ncbi:hypothetical protein BL253_05795 [Pseudofrankia asymbiotica]|uniref:Uncharacterized protein n=1 Tax=Pseudofrankia asymbiotica TaxID=1834516 RepID=A0A1V2IGJ6_9ACTN|nr:hypothetical protein BL253_05795 [Pseudofrankia asymbiotica]
MTTPRPLEEAGNVTTATTTGDGEVPMPPEDSPKPAEPAWTPVLAISPKPVDGPKPPVRAVRRDGDESPSLAAPGGGSVEPVWPTAVSTGRPRPR